MSVKTDNIYGKIIISDRTIAKFISHVALDSYGFVRFVPKNFFEKVKRFFRIGYVGVRVKSTGERVYLTMSVIVKYGVSVKAVVDALKESIKYKVEKFTGMVVDTIDVNVMGVGR